VEGTYVLQLCVSDGTLSDEATVQVVAGWPNVGPYADAGSDRLIRGDETVTLDWLGSADADNGPAPLSFPREPGGRAAEGDDGRVSMVLGL
jgi:hypothetical protein